MLRGERGERLGIVVEADADDLEAAVVVAVVELAHAGNLGHAGAAPRRPEVDEHHLAGECGLIEGRAVEEGAHEFDRLAGQ